jgi:hypothetical protein
LAVDKRLYLVDAALQALVAGKLHESFSNLLAGSSQSAMFLYMHGLAGVGKSAFVKVLREALQSVVRAKLDPFRSVEVVRIPLNTTTPKDLHNVIYVKGLSDWSIERIVEQTLCKNGFVIVHLEENPEDQALQTELFALVHSMLNKTFDRYPDKRGQVIVVFTSNYEPSPEIRSLVGGERGVMELQAPGPEVRTEWCQRSITGLMQRTAARGGVKAPAFEVDVASVLPTRVDMRQLDAWKQSVGYFLTQHVAARGASGESWGCERVLIHLSPVGVGGLRLRCEFTDALSGARCSQPLELFSADGILMCPVEYKARIRANDALSGDTQMRLLALSEMVRREFIKPGVVVVQGGNSGARAAEVKRISHSLGWMCGPATTLTSLSLQARHDEDKASITGDPDPTYGRLPRFISSINGPAQSKDALGVVLVECNVHGQFILREYLESDVSRTHVTAVRKERVLFVLNLDDGQALSPQVRSRANVILSVK